jgi:hypothetical protein
VVDLVIGSRILRLLTLFNLSFAHQQPLILQLSSSLTLVASRHFLPSGIVIQAQNFDRNKRFLDFLLRTESFFIIPCA